MAESELNNWHIFIYPAIWLWLSLHYCMSWMSVHNKMHVIYLRNNKFLFSLFRFSGIDMVTVLEYFGLSSTSSTISNNITSGASTFVVAYAIHKVFAPFRISITLVSVPFVVRYLRSKGILAVKSSKKPWKSFELWKFYNLKKNRLNFMLWVFLFWLLFKCLNKELLNNCIWLYHYYPIYWLIKKNMNQNKKNSIRISNKFSGA